MTSVRRVPTTITSSRALVAALEQGGFKVVERHSAPQPLLSWRKQPMGVSAEIIVRRAQIGSTADDLGFTRGPSGAFEAILSDIHLSRFDRRWFQKLAERAASAAAAAGESYDAPVAVERAPLRAPPVDAAPPTPDVASVPRRPAVQADAFERDARERSRRTPPAAVASAVQDVLQEFESLESAAAGAAPAAGESLDLERELLDVLGAARKAGGSLGCAPVVFGWLLVSAIGLSNRSPQVLFFASVVAIALFLRAVKQRSERMAAAGAAAFAARFRGNPQLREHALRKLRAGLVKQGADLKPVVEQMLRRLGG